MENSTEQSLISGLISRSKYFFVTALMLVFMQTSQHVHAQESVLTIEAKAHNVSIDPFNNLYLLTEDNEYVKYDKRGKIMESYTDLQLNEASYLSSDHPFKSMVYYPQYELIRVFGNKLQVLAELNLSAAGFGEITAVAPSTGYQSFWLFDATAQKLIRISQNYSVEYDGTDLTSILDEVIFPEVIKEREGWLYVYDKENGLYIFDSFGAFSRKLNVLGANSFSVFKSRLFFTKDGNVFEVDPYTAGKLPLKIQLDGEILSMAFRQIILSKGNTIEVIRF